MTEAEGWNDFLKRQATVNGMQLYVNPQQMRQLVAAGIDPDLLIEIKPLEER